MAEKKSIGYEYLRIMETIAVVANHVCSGLFNNYTIEELERTDAAFLHSTYTLVSWAVPVFLMITGGLLLNPNKEVGLKKIQGYILRMVAVLFTFGGGYAVLELIFYGAPISISTLLRGYVNMLERSSWSHMWYVYMLISLYIITPALKAVIKGLSKDQFDRLMIALVIGNIGIDTVNDIFNTIV